MAGKEKNRAAAVALNAEIRRIKSRLMEEVPKLEKLAMKKVPFFLYYIKKKRFSFCFEMCFLLIYLDAEHSDLHKV